MPIRHVVKSESLKRDFLREKLAFEWARSTYDGDEDLGDDPDVLFYRVYAMVPDALRTNHLPTDPSSTSTIDIIVAKVGEPWLTHVYVIWDDWAFIDPEERSEIIREVAVHFLTDEERDRLVYTCGLTSIEERPELLKQDT